MSPKLPVITPKKLIRALEKAGFILNHQTGSHRYYTHPERPKKIITIPYHNKDLKKGTLKSILKQADMDVETLIELL
jgi:predicted RNA binding protein YcfA (HicA-like mRNA interferase family)